MERLISSPSSTSPSLHLPKFTNPSINGFSMAQRSNLSIHRRLNPLSPSLSTTATTSCCLSSAHVGAFISPLHPSSDSDDGDKAAAAAAPSPILRKFATANSVVLLSTLSVTLIQLIFAPLANATTAQTTSTTGGLISAELLSSAWTGLFAGCLHTLSGPDHLAALAPLSIGRTNVESAIVGALWGCGHDAGQLIFGLIFLLLKDRLHIEIIRTWGTRVVGLTLLVIGVMGIKEASEAPAPFVSEPLEVAPSGKKKIGFATFATGVVHGLQPDALMMVLPALALPSRVAGAAFLGMFLVGTVLAMGSYAAFIGSCSLALKERVPRITEKLTWAASFLAISMGVAIIVSPFLGFNLY